MIELDVQMFNGWKTHPVTQAVFKRLQEIQENIRDEILSDHAIMSSSKRLAYLAGERKSIEMMFELSIEDIKDENSESSGIQRSSEAEKD